MEKGQYFVQVRDPVENRRNLLGSSKQIIHILQKCENLRSLRVKKAEKLAVLRNLNKELNLLTVKLKNELPQVDLRVKLETDKTESKPVKIKNNPSKDILKLEDELKMIEEKLNRLN